MGSLARRSGQPPRRAVRGARGRAGRRAGRVVSGGVARCAREAGAGRAHAGAARAMAGDVRGWRVCAAARTRPARASCGGVRALQRRGHRGGGRDAARGSVAWRSAGIAARGFPRNGAIRRSCCRAISTGRGWTGWRRGMRSTWRDAFCRSTAAWRPCLSRCSSPRIRPSRVGDVEPRASLRCTHCTTDNPSAVNAGRRSPDASSCCITIRCCSTSAKTSSRSIWSCSGARCTASSVANSCAVSMLVPRWRLREMRAGEQQCMQGPCRVAWRRRYPPPARGAMWHHTAARARCKVFNGV